MIIKVTSWRGHHEGAVAEDEVLVAVFNKFTGRNLDPLPEALRSRLPSNFGELDSLWKQGNPGYTAITMRDGAMTGLREFDRTADQVLFIGACDRRLSSPLRQPIRRWFESDFPAGKIGASTRRLPSARVEWRLSLTPQASAYRVLTTKISPRFRELDELVESDVPGQGARGQTFRRLHVALRSKDILPIAGASGGRTGLERGLPRGELGAGGIRRVRKVRVGLHHQDRDPVGCWRGFATGRRRSARPPPTPIGRQPPALT